MPVRIMRGKAFARISRILVNAFFFLPLFGFSQFNFDRNCLDAYRSVLSLHFNDARSSLSLARKADPANLVPVYLEDYMDFLTVFTGQEQAEFESYRRAHEKRIGIVKGGTNNSSFYGYCLGNMNLQWAVARMQFGEKRAAIVDLSRAFHNYGENLEKYPSFIPVKTGLGFLHVLAGLAGDSYGWLLELAGFSGSVEGGLREIGSVADYNGKDEFVKISSTEAIFFLAMASAFLDPERSNASVIIQKFDDKNDPFPGPDNPLVIFAKSTVYLKCGMNEEAIRILDSYRASPGEQPFWYLDFLAGKAHQNRLDTEAGDYFTRFLKNFKGKNYVRSAIQKLAWSYLLAGDTLKYRECISRIIPGGSSLVDVDEQALREAGSKEIPNIFLLRARLLCDGGYYDRALDVLLGSRVSDMIRSKKDLVEYNYRLGRIWQGEGREDKALRNFDEAIRLGKDLPWYFAANAALQSGLIYEKKNNYGSAEKYFTLCLSMDPVEYKTSLDQKARAGLKRIRK